MGLAILKPGYGGNIAVVVVGVGVGQEILRGGAQIKAYRMVIYHRRSSLAGDRLISKLLHKQFILRSNAAAGEESIKISNPIQIVVEPEVGSARTEIGGVKQIILYIGIILVILLPIDIEDLFGQAVEVIVLVGKGDAVAAPCFNKAADKVVGVIVGEVSLVVYAACCLAFVVADIYFLTNNSQQICWLLLVKTF